MAKYGKKTQKKVKKVMEEFKDGKLRIGGGKKVKSRKQAIAIGLSEARREGDKVPPRKKSSGTKSKSDSKTKGQREPVKRKDTKAKNKKKESAKK